MTAGWLITNRELLHPAFASHNARSIAAVAARVEAAGLAPGWLEIQALHGMAEPLRAAVAARGHRVRVYAPYGDLLGGMAYLVRRLLENTSNDGFVRALFLDRRAGTDLLVDPMTIPAPAAPAPAAPAFRNAPLLDFADPSVRSTFDQALAALPWDAAPEPVMIGGVAHREGPLLEVRPPSQPSRSVPSETSGLKPSRAAEVNIKATTPKRKRSCDALPCVRFSFFGVCSFRFGSWDAEFKLQTGLDYRAWRRGELSRGYI